MNKLTITTALVMLAAPLALIASSSTDRKIEDAAKSSYNFHAVLEDRVVVKANDGVVTLSGVVLDSEDKSLAEDTIQNFPGVTRVNNEITVKQEYPEHSDAWMAFKIRSRLLMRSNVSVADTKVSVQDGVVTLTGTADSEAQKELTAIYAREIDWVKGVNNQLVVNATPNAKQTVGEKIDDASITSQIKFALLSHKSTSALKTKITTTDGAVRVTGDAANEAEKSLVTKLAMDIRGTKSVSNDMKIVKR